MRDDLDRAAARGLLSIVMAGPILYSTNPWYALEIGRKYRKGVYFAWVCECFDSSKAAAGTAAAMIAPSSNPCRIYEIAAEEVKAEEKNSPKIKGYKKTFTRLAKEWSLNGSLTEAERDEIIVACRGPSWRIWRPVLYVIPREPIENAGRLNSVKLPDRAAYGPEMQIVDLQAHEFDVVELTR